MRHDFLEAYNAVRKRSLELVSSLEIEDFVVQTAEFMSPPRWHIGHQSWFFEMYLKKFVPGYQAFREDYLFYFNSYYDTFGTRILRARRGTVSRPTVKETLAYRRLIDGRMGEFIESMAQLSEPTRTEAEKLLAIGIQHEMQHQELLVYDIKHLLCDAFVPPFHNPPPQPPLQRETGMATVRGGLFQLGYAGPEFSWDNERPRHTVFVEDFEIDRYPVTNGEYLSFIEDGGYKNFRWWHSDGWKTVRNEQWDAPLYWQKHDGEWFIHDIGGARSVRERAHDPVCHVSYYEAHAYAKWSGKRLPTEAEWEKAAAFHEPTQTKAFVWPDDVGPIESANFIENGYWTVAPCGSMSRQKNSYGCAQMLGDVWEWTSSDYAPFPRFQPDIEEYNDKWFINQKVLKGGSFATPRSHLRTTYRNFFYPHDRWVTSGFRCARSL